MKILRFVLPTLGIWIMNPILSLVDTAVVGQTRWRPPLCMSPFLLSLTDPPVLQSQSVHASATITAIVLCAATPSLPPPALIL